MSQMQATTPLAFQSLPRKQKHRVERIVEKVVINCAAQGRTADLLAEIYLAGVYHGSSVADANPVDEAS